MATPRQGYHTKDGKRVPSVTTILGFRKEAGPLMHWAWECGRDGKDYRAERDKAANAGTYGHALIESFTTGKPLEECDPPENLAAEQKALGEGALASFKEWAKGSQLEIVATEVQMVSERFRCGGTLDAVARVNGELAILDYKTGNGVYYDAIIQTVAYREFWNEVNPDRPCGDRVHILRIGKEHADFVHRSFAGLEDALRAFELMREQYDICQRLRKRAQ